MPYEAVNEARRMISRLYQVGITERKLADLAGISPYSVRHILQNHDGKDQFRPAIYHSRLSKKNGQNNSLAR